MSNHVWLHKPIVPLWQMAASMKLLGVSTLACGCRRRCSRRRRSWLTYAIGRELLRDRRAGADRGGAAGVQPGDHVARARVRLQRPRRHRVLVLGRAGGLVPRPRDAHRLASRGRSPRASRRGSRSSRKTYPAFIVTGIALLAWLLPLRGFADAGRVALQTHATSLILLGATLLTAAPWTLWTASAIPARVRHEQLQRLPSPDARTSRHGPRRGTA